jgi:hypothetical protein
MTGTRPLKMIAIAAALTAGSLWAQAPASPEQPAARPAVTAESHTDSRSTREELRTVLERYPPEVGKVLRLDPSLFGNASYIANYPALAAFLAEHPEVAHSPAFFLEGIVVPYDSPRESSGQRMWRETMEMVAVFAGFMLFIGVLTWLIRTLIDHRRWSRISRVQAEVHTKLMDRFSANDDLLAYIQTPAGKKFLESAPIALESPRAISAPLSRILWSVQVGIVLIALGLGMQFVSGTVDKDVSAPMSALGVLGISVGIGFVLSAFLSFVLSRRLGLLGQPAAGEPRSVAE